MNRNALEKKLDNFCLFFSIFALVGKTVVLPKATADAKSSFREVFANPISLNLEFKKKKNLIKKSQERQSKIHFNLSGIFSGHLSKLV